jgi:poly-gamma-glutamate capsule biosynthesis protein CapA/YwtB (metallophosphatase superfamily)
MRKSLCRRDFIQCSAGAAGAALIDPIPVHAMSDRTSDDGSEPSGLITLFLCGDVMLGRGIDQILPHPGDPQLYEPAVSLATTYVELAERANGPIPRPVDFPYVWGDALEALRRVGPDLRIINLETSVTESGEALPKGINYKMNPKNVACLTAAGIDCCVLANNHVLDWGDPGLLETLDTLDRAGIPSSGTGRDAAQAEAPAVLEVPGKGRVLVFAFGSVTSGIPRNWAAGANRAGVNLLADLSDRTIAHIADRVLAAKRPGDVAVASIHWGVNWGYEIPAQQTQFAHGLIDRAGFDVVHGHSSHHPKAIEIYRGKPILYGCGDFLNDYEGIAGYEELRDDLAVMYLPRFAEARGELTELGLQVFQIRKFRLNRASEQDTAWLLATLERESRQFGTRIERRGANRLSVFWHYRGGAASRGIRNDQARSFNPSTPFFAAQLAQQ